MTPIYKEVTGKTRKEMDETHPGGSDVPGDNEEGS